eukprot:scaffold5366_cov75-Skeletonema_dohrnii-CCMP3373.AAC.3
MKEVPPVPTGIRSMSGTSAHVGVNWQTPGGVKLQIGGRSRAMPTLTWALMVRAKSKKRCVDEEWMSQNRSGTQRGLINVRSVTSQSGVQITGTQAGGAFSN